MRGLIAVACLVALAIGALSLWLAPRMRFPGLAPSLFLGVLGTCGFVAGTRITFCFQAVARAAPTDKEAVLQAGLDATRLDITWGVVAALLTLLLPLLALRRVPAWGASLGWGLSIGIGLVCGWRALIVAHGLISVWALTVMLEGADPTALPTPSAISANNFTLMGAGAIGVGLGSLMTGISGVLGMVGYARRLRDEPVERGGLS